MPSVKLGGKMGGPFLTRQLWLKAGSWTMWRITGPSARERLLAQGVRDLPGWTLRVALDYFVEVYGRAGTGEQYANKWLASRGLDHHPLGVELKRLLTMVDVGLLYDGLDVMNSAAFELIARRCYSIERVLVETGSESDAYVLLELFEAALLQEQQLLPLKARKSTRRRRFGKLRGRRKARVGTA